ncbi:hypothetical protein AAVH_10689 [Aphelenchoides avenae]|nr:hypothetical protein AAVH_10689 [Aphelenchus avenae]
MLSVISSASPIDDFTESRRADDSGVGSDIDASSPAAAIKSLSDSVTNGCANGVGPCPAGQPATSDNYPVLSRLLQRPPKPLRMPSKRPNCLQGLHAVDDKPAKHARVEPNS